jgi:hypothetical protein
MSYRHVSVCPRCGAPIYECKPETAPPVNLSPDGVPVWATEGEGVPEAFFTCACRFALPDATPIEEGTEDSAEVQDRKYLARHRTADEPASEERVNDDR